jgi:hypothetical protein
VISQPPDDFLFELHAAFPDALISSVKGARHNLRKTAPSKRLWTRLSKAG